VAVAARLLLLFLPGHPIDVAAFQAWAIRMAEVGPLGFYDPDVFADYMPAYLLILWPVGYLVGLWPDAGPVLVKAIPAAADFAVAGLLAQLGGEHGRRAAIWYLLNPAVLFVGALWGQVESVAVAWILAGWLAMTRGQMAWAGALIGFGVLTKPQYAAVLPLALLWMLRVERAGRDWMRAAVAGAAAIVLPSLLFGLTPTGLVSLLLRSANVYPYGSVNALNLWHLTGLNWRPDATVALGMPVVIWGQLLVVVALLVVLAACWRSADRGRIYLATATIVIAVFALATRMHERYLFPALPFLLLAWAHGRAGTGQVVVLSAALLGNLVYGFAYLSIFEHHHTPLWASVWGALAWPVDASLAALSVGLTGWLLAAMLSTRAKS
jgi:Gpi18-like mannosyltransferase